MCDNTSTQDFILHTTPTQSKVKEGTKMSDVTRERPIVTKLAALERAIARLEDVVTALESKAVMYLEDVEKQSEEPKPKRREFNPTVFILDTLQDFTDRVGRMEGELHDVLDRLV